MDYTNQNAWTTNDQETIKAIRFDFVIFGLNFLPDFANCLLALMEKQF